MKVSESSTEWALEQYNKIEDYVIKNRFHAESGKIEMFEAKMTRWAIMDKDRTVIAKGTVRTRHLTPIDQKGDRKHILYYSAKSKAKAMITKKYGFFTYEVPFNGTAEEWRQAKAALLASLEPVKVEITIREI
jgi:hypothetical protein